MPNFMVLPPFEREHDADLARRNGLQPAVGTGFLQVPATEIGPAAVSGYLFKECDSHFERFVYCFYCVYSSGRGFFDGH
jgi:hypothetical protein